MQDELPKDVKHGLRLLVRKPGFTILAVVALAIGIGANTVAFTFVKSLLFYRLPVRAPERLIRIYGLLPQFQFGGISYPEFLDIAEQSPFLEGILAEKLVPLNLGTEGRNERIWGYAVSGNYFTLLGVSPEVGQFFHHEGYEPGKHPVAVLSYGFWKNTFAGDPGIVGRTIILNGHPFTVVGITPKSFTGTNVGISTSVWAPASMAEQLIPGLSLDERRNRSFLSIGRLAEGVTVDEAREGLKVIAKRLAAEFPDSHRGIGYSVLPESEGGIHPVMRGGFIGFAGILAAVVVLVLLLACANVAGLLLSRNFYRRKEVSLRVALGATRRRLILQFSTESALLSLLAGTCGLLVAWYAMRLLSTLRPPTDVPLYLPLALDGQVLLFSFLLTVLTGILFGLAPALQASQPDLVFAMKEGIGSLALKRSTLRSGLIAGQMALSTLLLVGTGLFLRSLGNARSVDLGFDPRGVVRVSVDLGLQGYGLERGRIFFRELEERVAALPGVASVGWANMIPFDLNINTHQVAPEGYVPPPEGGVPPINRNVVSPGYFATIRTPLVDGRDFDEGDDGNAPPVVIVNESLARRFWPNERAVGKRLGRPGAKMFEVVGVVGDGKYLSLAEEPRPFLFYPLLQREELDMTLVLRTKTAPSALLPLVREVVRAMDPSLPVYNVKTMEEHLQVALAPAKAGAALLGSFGILALLLASIGLYGMVAFWVAQRTFEIGIRRALGAGTNDIYRSVIGEGMTLALIGVGMGLLAGLATSRLAVSLLYGIDPLDPIAFGAAVAVLLATAFLACSIPARRALGIDPIVALRYE